MYKINKKKLSVAVMASALVISQVSNICVSANEVESYTVQAGDSFWAIADKLNIPMDKLIVANGKTNSSIIHPGDVLIIPSGDKPENPTKPTDLEKPGSTEQKPTEQKPAEQKPEATDGSKNRYTVKAGDCLSVIADRFNIPMGLLLYANGISINTVIHPGDVLIIPSGDKPENPTKPTDPEKPGSTEQKPTEQKPEATDGSKNRYTVKAGDCLSVIADKFDIPMESLLYANGISINTVIHPGDVLIIPSKNKPESPTKPEQPEQQPEQNPAEQKPESPTDSETRYLVQLGDSFWAIANKFGVPMSSLIARNGMTENTVIIAGITELIIPSADYKPEISEVPTKPIEPENTDKPEHPEQQPEQNPTEQNPESPTDSETRYLVQPGDSFWAIANKFGVPMSSLIARNGMTENTIIIAGVTELIIPGEDYKPEMSETPTVPENPTEHTEPVIQNKL